MKYQVKTIKHESQLNICNLFRADRLLWGTVSAPETYGRMGFVPEEGFYLHMICEEDDPKRIYKKDNDPVYKDSAMEAFFQFAPGGKRSDIYLNFEMNANAAMLAKYGENREDRKALPPEAFGRCGCRAQIHNGYWEVRLHIPLSVLTDIYGPFDLNKGTIFYCNFYKISEDPSIEHYTSFAPIDIAKPDFHRPEYFAEAGIE